MRFLLTRPLNDSESVARQLRKKDQIVYVDPLMTIEPLDEISINLSEYQAFIFTSPNAVRCYCQSNRDRNISVFAVGNKTAHIAETSGFREVFSANGDVQKLYNTIKSRLPFKTGTLLYLCGKHVSGDLKSELENVGFEIEKKEIYNAVAVSDLSDISKMQIKSGDIDYIPFYSKRSALIFIELAEKAKLLKYLTNVIVLCLSPSIEVIASSVNWKKVMTAKNPNQNNLYKLIDIDL